MSTPLRIDATQAYCGIDYVPSPPPPEIDETSPRPRGVDVQQDFYDLRNNAIGALRRLANIPRGYHSFDLDIFVDAVIEAAVIQVELRARSQRHNDQRDDGSQQQTS